MKRSPLALVMLIAGGILLLFGVIVGIAVIREGKGLVGEREDKVAIVNILGAITSSEDVIRQLQRYGRDASIKGVVIRVDSPGGEVAPSQEIYEEVSKLREKGKVVVASMGSVATSGGYYISCAADRIVANPGSITGSIGVIIAFPNLEKIMKRVGLDAEVIKSGDHKDMGSPFRSVTEEERAILQGLIDDVYDQFVEVVSTGRGMEKERVLQLADGGIFSGRQALNLGLVDKLGNLQDAVDLTAEMAGITGPPRIVRGRPKGGILWRLIRGEVVGERLKEKLFIGYPSFQYLWSY